MEVQLWNEDATALLWVVHDAVGPAFRDARGVTGNGELTVPLTDRYKGYFARDLVVKHVLDGQEVFAWVIEQDTEQPLADPPTITAAGRGILCWAEWGVIHPFRGLKRKSHKVRFFGFGSGQYYGENSLGVSYVTPFERERTELGGIVEGWPTPTQWQIWTSPPGEIRPAGEQAWFRHGFSTDTPQTIRVDACADDEMDVWLDDELIISMDGTNTTNPGGKVMRTVRMGIPAGTHRVSVRGRQRTAEDTERLGGSSEGQAWVALRIASITDDDDTGTMIDLTSSFWDASTTEPGWTVGLSMNLAINEATDRGVDRVYWTDRTYDNDFDSNGEEWPHTVNRSWPVGTDLLKFFEDLTEYGADIWATPDKALHAAINRGVDRSDTVKLWPAKHLESFGITRKHKVRTHATVNTDAGWTQVTDAAGLAEHGRAEVLLDLSSEDSIAMAKATATRLLAPMAAPSIETDGNRTKLIPWTGATPYKDFQLGDIVSIPTGTARVMGISYKLGDDGSDEWYLELDIAQHGARTPAKSLSQRLLTLAASGGAASAGGRIQSASKK